MKNVPFALIGALLVLVMSPAVSEMKGLPFYDEPIRSFLDPRLWFMVSVIISLWSFLALVIWRQVGWWIYYLVAILSCAPIQYGWYYWSVVYPEKGAEMVKKNEAWDGMGRYLNPLLLAYRKQHPEKFRWLGPRKQDDSVEVDGFIEYLSSLHPPSGFPVRNGHLIDPWGNDIVLAANRDNDVEIHLGGGGGPIMAINDYYHRPQVIAVAICQGNQKVEAPYKLVYSDWGWEAVP